MDDSVKEKATVILSEQNGPYNVHMHTCTRSQSGVNTFGFQVEKSISINITYFNGLQVAIDRE